METKEIWCAPLTEHKVPAADFDERFRYFYRTGAIMPPKAIIKDRKDIDGIRESGKRNIEILDFISEYIKEGMSTEEIDRLIAKKTKELNAIAAPLNYNGFPKSACTSINDQVCHGIPSEKDVLKSGDTVNVDVSTIYKGYFSDSSRTFCIGEVLPEKKKLVSVARECVLKGIEKTAPWNFMGDMGHAVHQHALKNGYSVVEVFGGHGTGNKFHEEPFVSFVTKPKTEMLMVPGMIFTIEPMVNMGKPEVFIDKENDWTVYTKDGLASAQWEVTVLVTDTGHEILAY